MARFIKRVCFVVPCALANIVDDVVMLLTLQYYQTTLGMRWSAWWFKNGFGQY